MRAAQYCMSADIASGEANKNKNKNSSEQRGNNASRLSDPIPYIHDASSRPLGSSASLPYALLI
jgi:hypothetical protein